MADLTQGAVDGLLGLLTSAIKEEARLLGGVQGDIQFIKDEMDSMNGFLLHLTKTETEHNDQHRAWMKQVRDISYVAQDCIELYLRDLSPPGGTSLWARIRHLPKLVRTWPTRRNLANQLHELKDRVREVGERRQRYGVSVPEKPYKPEEAGKDGKDDEKLEEFTRVLEHDAEASSSPSFSKAIALLPSGLPTEAGKDDIEEIIAKFGPGHVKSKKMFLCALYAHPQLVTNEELKNLKNKLMDGRKAVDVKKEVMLFSYRKLSTHYKSCLQYLTAFLEESSISRTSLVRRWLAERLVARDDRFPIMEDAGERCFKELVFLGFVRPARPVVPGLKIKSCKMGKSARNFIIGMAESENFVAGAVPTHLRHQIMIRHIAQLAPPEQPPKQRPSCNICPRKKQLQLLDDGEDNSTAAEEKRQHPMDAMAHLLKNLPKEYRLNVLDLGGCSTLKDRHLKSIICKVIWLKYLCIQKTNVTWLPKEINNLRQLETLDVRQTNIRTTDTKHVILPQLKHLLAGAISHLHETDESLITVQMPRKLARSTEILRYVKVRHGQAELEPVGNLKKLRKLGVVIQGSEDNMKYLRRAIAKLSESLRSLSVWIDAPASDTAGVTLDDNDMAGNDTNAMSIETSPPKYLESLNIKYFNRSNTSCSLPSWINKLKHLSKITLRDTQLTQNHLQTLAKLESLRCLRLRRGSYTDTSMILERDSFPKLRFLMIEVTPTVRISFQEDAAPKLEKIVWTLNNETVIEEGTISGIKHLISLEELELNGNNWSDKGRSHVEQQLREHPKFPHLLSFYGTHAHEVPVITEN